MTKHISKHNKKLNGGDIIDINKNMVLVDAGRFEMGDDETEDSKKHLVTITRDYYISKHQLTFAEYDEFCDTPSSSYSYIGFRVSRTC